MDFEEELYYLDDVEESRKFRIAQLKKQRMLSQISRMKKAMDIANEINKQAQAFIDNLPPGFLEQTYLEMKDLEDKSKQI